MFNVLINSLDGWRFLCGVETEEEAEKVADYCRKAGEQAMIAVEGTASLDAGQAVGIEHGPPSIPSPFGGDAPPCGSGRPKEDSGIDLAAEIGGEG